MEEFSKVVLFLKTKIFLYFQKEFFMVSDYIIITMIYKKRN